MYYEQDYVLRVIHDAVRMIAKLVLKKDIEEEDFGVDKEILERYRRLTCMIDDGEINRAENELTDGLDPRNSRDFQLALFFYDYLNKKDNAFLETHDFSREEILGGLTYAVNLYGYADMLGAFVEDLDRRL